MKAWASVRKAATDGVLIQVLINPLKVLVSLVVIAAMIQSMWYTHKDLEARTNAYVVYTKSCLKNLEEGTAKHREEMRLLMTAQTLLHKNYGDSRSKDVTSLVDLVRNPVTTAQFCRGSDCVHTLKRNANSIDWWWIYHNGNVLGRRDKVILCDQAVPWKAERPEEGAMTHALRKIFPASSAVVQKAGVFNAVVVAFQFGNPVMGADGVPLHVKDGKTYSTTCWKAALTNVSSVWDVTNGCNSYTMCVKGSNARRNNISWTTYEIIVLLVQTK